MDKFDEMVQQNQETTQCAVFDQTPGSQQRKINIIVRPQYTVAKVISDIRTQYTYDKFNLLLQPSAADEDLVYLNDMDSKLLYQVAGFQPSVKNTLILLPPDAWDGDVKRRYDLTLAPLAVSPSSILGATGSNIITGSSTSMTCDSNAINNGNQSITSVTKTISSATKAINNDSTIINSATKIITNDTTMIIDGGGVVKSFNSDSNANNGDSNANNRDSNATINSDNSTVNNSDNSTIINSDNSTINSGDTATISSAAVKSTSKSIITKSNTISSSSTKSSVSSTKSVKKIVTSTSKIMMSGSGTSTTSITSATTSSTSSTVHMAGALNLNLSNNNNTRMSEITQSKKKIVQQQEQLEVLEQQPQLQPAEQKPKKVSTKIKSSSKIISSSSSTEASEVITNGSAASATCKIASTKSSIKMAATSATGNNPDEVIGNATKDTLGVKDSPTKKEKSPTKDKSPKKDSTATKDKTPAKDSTATKDTPVKKKKTVTKDKTPTKDTSTTTKDTSVTKDTSTTKETSTTKDTSATKDTSVTKDTSPTKDTSVTKDTSITKDTSVSNDASASKDTSITKDTSALKVTSSTKDTSALKVTSSTKDTSFTKDTTNSKDTTITASTETTASKAATVAIDPATTVLGVAADSPPTIMTPITPDPDTNSIQMSPMSDQEQMSDDDLALGASASPTESEAMNDAHYDEQPLKEDILELTPPLPGLMMLDEYRPYNYTSKKSPRSPVSSDVVPFTNDGGGGDDVGGGNVNVAGSSSAGGNFGAIGSPVLGGASGGAAAAHASNSASASGFVGLVNQAMTCYLNSLLQALFMTPEFRNALYRWEFDNDNEAKSITYQLQKLFLKLQTSKKLAVETTDLTRSFGWDSTEAWQQHDVQELCRVMFDALELKFKNTSQMNLIANLYEGKMIDYVRCLECGTEKQREDTFLDIPLAVRPFGSDKAYGSVDEALRSFVQPETLDGNNQYHCDTCSKKCDAHKGLKFKEFPYILTLHLKRFDFDYQTMHRIKLNDMVTFPLRLSLRSFVDPPGASGQADGESEYDVSSKTSKSSGHDEPPPPSHTNGHGKLNGHANGSASSMDEGEAGAASSLGGEPNNDNDDDEGIELSDSPTQHTAGSSSDSGDHDAADGYTYDLFAIMIHSGSASGGHYYANIKEFENNEWYCFNDQSVTPITLEDIEKSFGGGGNNRYFSSVYSPSTNAYMLMYRKVDAQRNERSMRLDNFPEHIRRLLPKLQSEEENRPAGRSAHHMVAPDIGLRSLARPRVYFYNPELRKLKVSRLYVSRDFDMDSVTDSAYKMLNVDQFAPLANCRLVVYNQVNEEILQSIDYATCKRFGDLPAADGSADLLLEYCTVGQEFETYEPGGSTWFVYTLNPATMEIDGPFMVYSQSSKNDGNLRRSIALRLHCRESQLVVATLNAHNRAFVAYDPQPTAEAQESLQALVNSKLRNLTYFYVNVPRTDPHSLEIMGIPTFEAAATKCPAVQAGGGDGVDVVDAALLNGPNCGGVANGAAANEHGDGPPPLANGGSQPESNSEDSSLSDRTLVESGGYLGATTTTGAPASRFSSASNSPQLSSPDEDGAAESYQRVHAYFNGSQRHHHPHQPSDDDAEDGGPLTNGSSVSASYQPPPPACLRFFHAIKIGITDNSRVLHKEFPPAQETPSDDSTPPLMMTYKVIVDSNMKIGAFKRKLEELIRVPAAYFKIQRKHETSDAMNPTQSLLFLSEAETMTVELGKTLQPDEHRAKIYYMRLGELDNNVARVPFVCDWVYSSKMTVAEAKRELVPKLHRIDDKYAGLSVSNCRIWLKGGRNPVKIMADDETMGNDVRSAIAVEFLVQQCADSVQPQPSDDSLTIFVRRWHPSSLQLGAFEEITIDKDGELRNILSKVSDIPETQISYTRMNNSFPCTNISLLSINGSLSWFPIPATIDKYPLASTTNGNLYFYKDTLEPEKELTDEERHDLTTSEKSRLDRLGCLSSSSLLPSSSTPRRERALKIYVDQPNSKSSPSTSGDATSPKPASGSGGVPLTNGDTSSRSEQ